MSSLNESTRYVVVDFASNDDEQRNVDLVPRSWVKYIKNSWKCAFPTSKEYDLLKSWVPQGFDPKPSWKYHYCKIVKQANDYKQGIIRLNKSITSNVLLSTDMEVDQTTNRPIVLKGQSLQEALQIVEDGDKTNKRTKRTNESALPMQTTDETDPPNTKKIKKMIRVEVQKEMLELQTNLLAGMANLRRNLQFDIKKKSESMKSNLIANAHYSVVQGDSESLGITLPIDNILDFQNFNEVLAEKTKQEAFEKTLYESDALITVQMIEIRVYAKFWNV